MLSIYNQIVNLTTIRISSYFLEKPLLDYSDYNYDKLKNLIKKLITLIKAMLWFLIKIIIQN